MKDFRVKVTVKNNRILSRMKERGFASVSEFCRVTQLSPQVVGKLILFQSKPVGRNGWSKVALDLAAGLGCYPADLWPKYMENALALKSSVEVSMDLHEVRSLPVRGESVMDKRLLAGLFDKLNEREKTVISMRFGLGGEADATLLECSEVLGVTPQRVRQIEAKAMRRMRRTTYVRNLSFDDCLVA